MNPYDQPIFEKETEVITYKRCAVDGEHYPVNQMKHDKAGCNWIHWSSLKDYLDSVKGTVSNEEFETLKNNLK